MERWEIKLIEDQLQVLNDCTEISPIVIFLKQNGLLEIQDEMPCNPLQIEPSSLQDLLDVLRTNKNGYECLVRGLHATKQTTALCVLLHGAEDNVLNTNPFKLYNIDLDIADILSKPVKFEGTELTLGTVLKCFDESFVYKHFHEWFDVDSYECYLKGEYITLSRSTIPKKLSQYIPPHLISETRLNEQVFKSLQAHTFLVENIDLNHLNRLANKSQPIVNHSKILRSTKVSINPYLNYEIPIAVRSSNQLEEVTTRFILLEKSSHFETISKIQQPAHWIKFENDRYFHIRSRPGNGLESIKEFLSDDKRVLSEEDFLLQITRFKTSCNAPLIISGQAGLGKSTLLGELARSLKEMEPFQNIIFLPFKEILKHFLNNQEVTYEGFQKALLRILAIKKFDKTIQKELFSCEAHKLYLFLDGLDETNNEQFDISMKIISCIVKDMKNARVIITTRPSLVHRLEIALGVLCFKLLEFEAKSSVSYFARHAETSRQDNTIGSIKDFDVPCASVFCAKDSITVGRPLLCRMLGHLYSNEGYKTMYDQEIPPIYEVYRAYMKKGLINSHISDDEQQVLQEFHLKSAIDLLFPGKPKFINCPDPRLVVSANIMEQSGPNSSHHQFVHRTFAEFIVAECIVEGLAKHCCQSQQGSAWSTKSLFVYILTEVASAVDKLVDKVRKQDNQKVAVQKLSWFLHCVSSEFSRRVVNHEDDYCLKFFHYGMLSNNYNLYIDCIATLKQHIRMFHKFTSSNVMNLLLAVLTIKSVELFEFVLDIFFDLGQGYEYGWKYENLHKSSVNFRALSKDKEHLNFINNLVADMQKETQLQNIIVRAVQTDSKELVEITTKFLYSISGNHELAFNNVDSLLSLALRRGNYQIVDFILSVDNVHCHSIDFVVNTSLENSTSDNPETIKQKQQILSLLLDKQVLHLEQSSDHPILSNRMHWAYAKFLIDKGANIMATDQLNQNIGHLAATYFSAEEYNDLVETIFQLSSADFSSHNAHYKLADPCYEHCSICRGITIFATADSTPLQLTPILAAVYNIQLLPRTLTILKKIFLTLSNVDKKGNSILHYAVYGKRTIEFLNFLIVGRFCKLDFQNDEGNTFLHYMTEYYDNNDYLQIVDLLVLQKQTSIFHVKNNDLQLPIHLAVLNPAIADTTLMVLTTNIDNLDFLDKNGLSFLMYSVYGKRSLTFLQTLIKMGVDVNLQDSKGDTFLHILALLYDPSDFSKLVSFIDGTCITSLFSERNRNSFLPVHCALLKNDVNRETFKTFRKYNVDFNFPNEPGRSVLSYAVKWRRSIHTLKDLIDMGADVMAHDVKGNTFLHCMPKRYTLEDYHNIMEYLVVKRFRSIYSKSNHISQRPVHLAAYYYDMPQSILKFFKSNATLENEAEELGLYSVDQQGNSVLHYAVLGKRTPSFLKLLIDACASIVQYQDISGNTFVHLLAQTYNELDFYDVANFLVSKGLTNVFQVTNHDMQLPIHLCMTTINNDSKTLQLFKNINIDFTATDINKFSLLITAACCRKGTPLIKTLIDLGANVMQQDNNGNTFGHYITKFYTREEFHEILEILMKANSLHVFTVANNLNVTPLHLAVYHLDLYERSLCLLDDRMALPEINRVMISFKPFANFNATDENGDSVLHWALRGNRSLTKIKYLISLGANGFVVNKDQSNLAHMAASLCSFEHLKYFVELGCDINQQDNDGDNTLHCVIKDATEDVHEKVEFLVSNGINKHCRNRANKTAYDCALEKGIIDKKLLSLLH